MGPLYEAEATDGYYVMADKRLQIIIDLQAGAAEKALKELQKALQGLGGQSKKTAKETDQVSKSLRAAAASVSKARVTVVRTSHDLSELAKRANTGGRAIATFGQRVWQAVRHGVKAMQAGLRRLITGLRKTGSTIRGAIGRLKAYVTQLRKVSRAQRKVASTAGFLKKVLVGIGVIVLLRKVVRGFQSATRIVADFQQAMSTVRAVTESTGEEFKALEARAKELGITTRFTATQAAEGMVALARGGFDAAQIISTVDDALLLAQAGALDLGDAAKLVAVSLKAFGIEAKDASVVTDTLAAAANSATTDVTELGVAMRLAGPFAKTAGLTFQETTAILAELADNALAGSLGGTSLRATLVRLAKPTGEAKKALAELGVDVAKLDIRQRGILPVLEEFRGKTIGVGQAAAIAGVRGGAGFQVLIASLDSLKRRFGTFDKIEGTARRIAEVMDDNLNGALLRVQSAWQGLILEMFETEGAGGDLTEMFNQLAQIIRDIADDSEGLGDIVASAIRTISRIVAVAIDLFYDLRDAVREARLTFATFGEKVNEIMRAANVVLAEAEHLMLSIKQAAIELDSVFVDMAVDVTKSLRKILRSLGWTLEAMNFIADAAVPDKFIDTVIDASNELNRMNRFASGFTDTFKEQAQTAVDASQARVNQLLKEKNEGEKFWAAETKAIEDIIANEEGRVSARQRLDAVLDDLDAKRIESNQEVYAALATDAQIARFEGQKTVEALGKAFTGLAESFVKAFEKTRAERVAAAREDAQIIAKVWSDVAKQTVHFAPRVDTSTFGGLLAQQAAESQRLVNIFAEKEERILTQVKDRTEQEAQLNALKNEKVRQQEDLAAKHRNQQFELSLSIAKSVFSDIGTAAANAYELSGKKSKEAFIVAKAASIAGTLVSTYESAQRAYGSLVGIPYVGPALGIVAAAAAIAAGLTRVALIRQQSLAEGGMIGGHSPHSKADNIPINATAGEVVHPVSAVKHYGTGFMEAVRSRRFPKSAIAGFSAPPPPPSHRFAFQAGGQVRQGPASPPRTPGEVEERPIHITNVTDPQMLDQYVASKPGERSVMNVISRNSFKLRQILEQ